jgi:hypothetical protein
LRTTCSGVCRFLVAIVIVLPAHNLGAARLSLNVDQPTGVRAPPNRAAREATPETGRQGSAVSGKDRDQDHAEEQRDQVNSFEPKPRGCE